MRQLKSQFGLLNLFIKVNSNFRKSSEVNNAIIRHSDPNNGINYGQLLL